MILDWLIGVMKKINLYMMNSLVAYVLRILSQMQQNSLAPLMLGIR